MKLTIQEMQTGTTFEEVDQYEPFVFNKNLYIKTSPTAAILIGSKPRIAVFDSRTTVSYVDILSITVKKV